MYDVNKYFVFKGSEYGSWNLKKWEIYVMYYLMGIKFKLVYKDWFKDWEVIIFLEL